MSIRHFVSLFKLNGCEELPVIADLSKTATNHVTQINNIMVFLNPLHATSLFLYPLKT